MKRRVGVAVASCCGCASLAFVLFVLAVLGNFGRQVRAREPIRAEIANRISDESAGSGEGRTPRRGILSRRGASHSASPSQSMDTKIGNLSVTAWKPAGDGPFPLVIFSHGFHGSSKQSVFLMQALCKSGYLVIAPNHKDALVLGVPNKGFTPSDESFAKPEDWSDATYKDRRDDIHQLLKDLRASDAWSRGIDWKKIALVGHSLGGYTVLGLAGGWKSWKLPEVKAVIALSPFCTPYTTAKTLGGITAPVMYQGGTADIGISPFVKLPNGAYDQTSSTKMYVEFQGAGHFAWTELNKEYQPDVNRYCIEFLDKFVKGVPQKDLKTRTQRVSELRASF